MARSCLAKPMSGLAGKDYFTVEEAADYAGISYSHWRARIQREFPPGEFYGKLLYRKADVEWRFGSSVPLEYQSKVRRLDAERRRRAISPSESVARRAKRRSATLQRTPAWADHASIRAVYLEAARLSRTTGVPHHVDHLVPLQGARVCGLHVETNLQILPAKQNLSKGNRW